MALRSTGASDPGSDGSLVSQRPLSHGRTCPQRTCIGCRQRAGATELLRVVALSGSSPLAVVPDPRRRAPGRGAWVHPAAECVELAERRRAFARAFRSSGPIDASAVREYLATSDPGTQAPTTARKTAGVEEQ